MTSSELLLAAGGSCAGFYAAPCLGKNKLSTESTRVRVTSERSRTPFPA